MCSCDDVADAIGISLLCRLRKEKEWSTAAMHIDTINKEQRLSAKTNFFWHFLAIITALLTAIATFGMESNHV